MIRRWPTMATTHTVHTTVLLLVVVIGIVCKRYHTRWTAVVLEKHHDGISGEGNVTDRSDLYSHSQGVGSQKKRKHQHQDEIVAEKTHSRPHINTFFPLPYSLVDLDKLDGSKSKSFYDNSQPLQSREQQCSEQTRQTWWALNCFHTRLWLKKKQKIDPKSIIDTNLNTIIIEFHSLLLPLLAFSFLLFHFWGWLLSWKHSETIHMPTFHL